MATKRSHGRAACSDLELLDSFPLEFSKRLRLDSGNALVVRGASVPQRGLQCVGGGRRGGAFVSMLTDDGGAAEAEEGGSAVGMRMDGAPHTESTIQIAAILPDSEGRMSPALILYPCPSPIIFDGEGLSFEAGGCGSASVHFLRSDRCSGQRRPFLLENALSAAHPAGWDCTTGAAHLNVDKAHTQPRYGVWSWAKNARKARPRSAANAGAFVFSDVDMIGAEAPEREQGSGFRWDSFTKGLDAEGRVFWFGCAAPAHKRAEDFRTLIEGSRLSMCVD